MTNAPNGLIEFVAIHAAERPKDDALVFGAERLSWADLHQRVRDRSAELRTTTDAENDRIVLADLSLPQIIVESLALLSIGANIVLGAAQPDADVNAGPPPTAEGPGSISFPQPAGSNQTLLVSHVETGLLALGTALAERTALTDDDVVLAIGSLDDPATWQLIAACLVSGAALMISQASDAPVSPSCREFGVTVLWVPNREAAQSLARSDALKSNELTQLRAFYANAEEELIKQFAEQLGDADVYSGFNLPEAMGVTICSDPSDPPSTIIETRGRPLAHTEIMIVDPTTGMDMLLYESGEVWLRGPGIFKGYLGDPAATDRVLERDGFLRTGTIGYLDSEGRLVVCPPEGTAGRVA